MAIRRKRISKLSDEEIGKAVVPIPDTHPSPIPDSVVVTTDIEGMVSRSVGTIKSAAHVGKDIEGMGTLRINNGILAMTTSALVDTAEKMRDIASGDSEERVPAARALASLANSVSKVSTQFRMANEAGHHKTPRKKRSFALGQAVQVNGNLNVQVNNGQRED